jgi:hypothetical protein
LEEIVKYVHPKFSPQRARALREVAEGRVTYWRGEKSETEHVDNWLVDGVKADPRSYDWLRAKNLITVGAPSPQQTSQAVTLSARGVDALEQENKKAAARDPDSPRARAARETTRKRWSK